MEIGDNMINDLEEFKQLNYRFNNLSNNDLLKEFYKWKIFEYKNQLKETDYKAIKYSEGYYTDEEYEPIKLERQELRNQIHEYEQEIEKLGD